MQGAARAVEQLGANGKTQEITEIKVVVVGDGGCGKTSLLMVFAKGEFPKVYIPTVFEKFSAPFLFSGKQVLISLWDTAERACKTAWSFFHKWTVSFKLLKEDNQTEWQSFSPPLQAKRSLGLMPDGENYDSEWNETELPHGNRRQEDYDRLRPLSYSGAHAIIMCYDVTNLTSFDNVLTKWYPEVSHFCRGIPILLVGCKTDLRKDRVLLRRLHQDQQEPITYQKGENLARRLHAVAYLECSACFQENISDIFTEVSKAALSIMKKNQCRPKRKRACLVS